PCIFPPFCGISLFPTKAAAFPSKFLESPKLNNERSLMSRSSCSDSPCFCETFPLQVLNDPTLDTGSNLGNSVDIDSDWLISGAPYATVNGKSDAGKAYLFQRVG